VAEPIAATSVWIRTRASFSVCLRMMRARQRADMQYRLSFALRLVGAAGQLLLEVVAIWALVHRFGSIGGWTLGPLTFLLGVSGLAFRLADAFIGGSTERCAELIRTGRLDVLLVRPAGLLWQVMGDAFAVRRLMQLATMVPFAVIGIARSDIHWTPLRVIVLVLVLVNSTVVFASIFVLVNCISFWAPTSQEIGNAFTYGGAQMAKYPIHIFDGWVRIVSVTFIPVAVTVYLPSFLLFDAPNPLGVTAWQSSLALGSGVPLAIAASLMWRVAVRHYRSTGS
jgi:ABC-2 type transport system permease protein